MLHWENVYIRACGFFFYFFLTERIKDEKKNDEDRCGITADCQKSGDDELQNRRRKKKEKKK
jgi:hypothetical protein